jgi:hypothetical protein
MDKRLTRFGVPSQTTLGISPAALRLPPRQRSGLRRASASLMLSLGSPSHSAQLWCTGKDSNLRTSLGGTDLQSVGFNHSPTCAETIGRCSRRSALPGNPQTRPRLTRTTARSSLHAGKVPNGVCWKTLLRCYRVRRLPITASEIQSGPELLEFPRTKRSGFRLRAHARKPPQLWSWRRDLNP